MTSLSSLLQVTSLIQLVSVRSTTASQESRSAAPDPRTVPPDNPSEGTYTLAHPEKSYLEYRHDWPPTHGLSFTVQVTFRTMKANAFVLHHTLVGTSSSVSAALSGLERRPPQLWAKLKKGTVIVTFSDEDNMATVSVGRSRSLGN